MPGFVEPIIAQTYYSLKEYLELFIDQYCISDPNQTDLLSHVDARSNRRSSKRNKIGETNIPDGYAPIAVLHSVAGDLQKYRPCFHPLVIDVRILPCEHLQCGSRER